MFEDLKAERAGARTKEKMRLWVTVGACLVLGTAIYGGRSGCAGEADRATPVAAGERREKEKREGEAPTLDRTPLIPLAEAGPAEDFDATALDFVVSHVRRGLSREPWKRLTPAEVLALDPKEAVGRLLEVRGVVRDLDREERALAGVPEGAGRLWAFALEGEDGARIAVVHPGSSQEGEEGRPRAALALPGSGAGTALRDGASALVRGIWLQQRKGTIARVSLQGPTPVLVGSEYRLTEPPNPPLEAVEQASFEKIQDRLMEGMRSTDSVAARQIVQWARTVGHDEIARRIRTDEWKAAPWAQVEFSKWRREMAAERKDVPDRREWTPKQRGKLFRLTGVFGDFVRDDWEQIQPNAQGVDVRWKFFMLSDHEGYISLTLDSPFPLSEFEGVAGRRNQRVVAYGVYVQGYSFEVKSNTRSGEIQAPFFVLMDLRPLDLPAGTPLLRNPFFWTWVSLAVLGAVFFLVMTRVERRERAAMETQHLRIRRRQRELGQTGAVPAVPPRGGAPASAPPAPPPAPPPGEPPSGGPS
jgi:hypothetical protein